MSAMDPKDPTGTTGTTGTTDGVDVGVVAAVRKLARQMPGRVALRTENASVSFGELAGDAGKFAALLAECGVGRGDRVAFLGLNIPAFVRTLLASSWLGAVFVPVNHRLTAAEAEEVLADSGTHIVVAEPGHREVVDAVAARAGVRWRILVDDDPAVPVTGEVGGGWITLGAALAQKRAPVEPVPCGRGDLAALMYTSGTTGRAKGVMLSHGNFWWNGVNLDSVLAARTDDVNLVVGPLFHTAPLGCFTLRGLTRGTTSVLRRGFEAEQTLADLVALRVTTLFAVPAVLAAIARVPGFATADLTSLRSVATAGAPAEPRLIAAYADRGVLVQQGWGLTETLFVSMLSAARTREKSGSVGEPLPYTEVRLVEPATGEVVTEPGRRGEAWVRGPAVTAGYWNNPEATGAAFAPGGWFRTGDIVERDADGCLYVVDRLKDMVIVGGDNVYPGEVQQVLAGFPGVVENAVVGMPDGTSGERVVAVLVCADGVEAPSLQQVRDFAAHLLATYKLPTRLHVVDALPRNAMGKINKVAIRAALATGDPAAFQAAAPAPSGTRPAAAAVAATTPTAPATPTATPTAKAPAPASPAADPAAHPAADQNTVPAAEEGPAGGLVGTDRGEQCLGAPRAADATAIQRHEVLLSLVTGHVAEVLGLSGPHEVDPERTLSDLGLGSLAAVDLCARLGRDTGLRLPGTLPFDYPTSAALTDRLHHLLQARAGAGDASALLGALDALETALGLAPPSAGTRAWLVPRLRGLLTGIDMSAASPRPSPMPPTGQADVARQIDESSDDELLALLDQHLGAD